MIGLVEGGLRLTLTKLGILEPVEALECMAVNLAQVLDGTNNNYGIDAKEKAAVAAINRELRLTLEKIEALHPLAREEKDDIADKY